MRKCEQLPGARVELLLDIPPNRMGGSERAPSQWRAPLAEKWAAPMPGCLWVLRVWQANFPNSPLLPSLILLPAQAACSLCWPVHPWPVPFLWLFDREAGRPWSCASVQGEAQMLPENLTPGRGIGGPSPTPPHPARGESSQELVSWGVRVGIKVLGGQHGWILSWVTNSALHS